MKCRSARHFIRACTVCQDKNNDGWLKCLKNNKLTTFEVMNMIIALIRLIMTITHISSKHDNHIYKVENDNNVYKGENDKTIYNVKKDETVYKGKKW